MKALTLQQPFALVGVMGLKPWETRPRPTKFRGTHLITASANWQPAYKKCMEQNVFKVATAEKEIHLGCIIGRASITDCVSTLKAVQIMAKDVTDGKMTKWEMERAMYFGNFEAGRFAYKWEQAVEFESPITCKGALGFWETSRQRSSYAIVPFGDQPQVLELQYLGQPLTQAYDKVQLQVIVGNAVQGMMPDGIRNGIEQIEKLLFKL